jgi:hypothetical protein
LKALDEWGWHQGGSVMFRPTKYKLLHNVVIENSIESKKLGNLGCALHAIGKPLMKRILWR